MSLCVSTYDVVGSLDESRLAHTVPLRCHNPPVANANLTPATQDRRHPGSEFLQHPVPNVLWICLFCSRPSLLAGATVLDRGGNDG